MAVRLAPADERAWSYLGYAYAKKGEVVEAAAAFRRAKQDALATELEHAATVRRPPTPSFHFGHVAAAAAARATPACATPRPLGRAAAPTPAAWPPTGGERRSLPAVAPTTGAGGRARRQRGRPSFGAALARRRRVSASGRRSPGPAAAAAVCGSPLAPAGRGTRSGLGTPGKPVEAVAGVAAGVRAVAARAVAGAVAAGRSAAAHDRRRGPRPRATRCSRGPGALEWQPAFRRAQGRRGTEPSATGGPFFRLTGAGDIWIAGTAERWLPVALTDDVLYVREDRVLAFDGQVSWEAGAVPGAGRADAAVPRAGDGGPRARRGAARHQGDRGPPACSRRRAPRRLGGSARALRRAASTARRRSSSPARARASCCSTPEGGDSDGEPAARAHQPPQPDHDGPGGADPVRALFIDNFNPLRASSPACCIWSRRPATSSTDTSRASGAR